MRSHNERVHLAWVNAALGGMANPNKLPKLESLMLTDVPPKRQSRSHMLAAVRSINAALGGKVTRKGMA